MPSPIITRQVIAPYIESAAALPAIDEILVVVVGESNAGGQATNASLASWQLAARNLTIFNNTSEVFESLDVGTNNLIGHTGLTDNATHGTEVGLADAYDEGDFDSEVVRLLKSGQGGSQLSDWDEGDSYYTTFLSRLEAAKTALGGVPNYCVWMFVGINDMEVYAVSAATFETRLNDLIDRYRAVMPNCEILINKLMVATSDDVAYNSAIDTIAAARAYVTAIDETGLTYADTFHYDYLGYHRLAKRFVQQMKSIYSLTGTGLTWTATTGSIVQDADDVVFASTALARSTVTIDLTASDLICDVIGNSLVYGIHESSGSPDFFNLRLGGYAVGGNIYSCGSGGSGTNQGALALPFKMKITRSGDDALLYSSADGGVTWTLEHTATGVLSGIGNVYARMEQAASSGRGQMYLG